MMALPLLTEVLVSQSIQTYRKMMMKKKTTPIVLGAVAKSSGNWYAMRALSSGSASIDLYGDIGGWGVTASEFRRDLKELGNVSSLDVHINSCGGSVTEGLAIYNTLKQHAASVTVYIDGLAASMASVIAMAANKIVMPANALMMIHNPWGWASGDAEDIRKYAGVLDKMKTSMLAAYSRSGMSNEEIASVMDEETWYTGQEAIEAGFADELGEDVEINAHYNPEQLTKFVNAPSALAQFIEASAKYALQTIENSNQPIQRQEDNDMGKPLGNNPAPATPKGQVTPDQKPQDQTVAQYKEAQKERKAEIRSVFEPFTADASITELLSTCIDDDDCAVEQARSKLLDILGKQSSQDNGVTGHQARIIANNRVDNGNLVGDSVKASLASRLGHAQAEKGNRYNGYTLSELARASLADRNIFAPGDRMQMIGLAFTHSTSDFGNILLDTAHKSLLKGYEEAPETFEQWTQKGMLSDFKVSHRVDLNTFPSLRQVREGAEYKHVTISDRGEQIMLATYGELFAISRQAIINDDLSVLSRLPMKFGRAARATIGDLVYAVLTGNSKMSDGKALFHADHSNLATGAMSIGGLSAMKALMKKQKNGDRTLNITPEFLLTPVALEDTAAQLIRSSSVPGTDSNSGIANPLKDQLTVIAEPRLDDDSAVKHYMVAGNMFDTIEVAYLDGNDKPYLEQQQGFTVDGVTSKVRIDAGVAPMDYRGMVRSTGA
jgi:ATP-dependent Clp endopeptidase proteolytic subunit ClpP